ncbi:MAG: glycosyltransferase family 4 protein [Bacteroidetes bacterium]|nr:glycosyltransferase family 4 protein [Bacteroidota bacterium]
MNILQICYRVPIPAKDGGCIAMNAITESILLQKHTVKVIALNTSKHFIAEADIANEYKNKTKFESYFIDTAIKPIKALLNLFSKQSYHIERFYSKEFEKRIEKILENEKFDIVHLESIYTAPYISIIKKHNIKIILRSHNVEHLIWERLTKKISNPLKKAYLTIQTKRLKHFEIEALNKVDGIISISKEDTRYFQQKSITKPIEDLSFGISVKNYNYAAKSSCVKKIGFIGALDWQPNYNGLLWFINTVWHSLVKQNHNLELHVAGRNTPDNLHKLETQNIFIHGEVIDAKEFISEADILVVPLFAGSGIRIKIIESMALGTPVVSTSIGMEGIPCFDENNIIIANNPEEFIKKISELIVNNDKLKTVAKNARLLVEKEFNTEFISQKLIDFYKKFNSGL